MRKSIFFFISGGAVIRFPTFWKQVHELMVKNLRIRLLFGPRCFLLGDLPGKCRVNMLLAGSKYGNCCSAVDCIKMEKRGGSIN